MTPKTLPSYHKTLLRYVTIFICLPVLVLFSFIYINLFNDNLENAEAKITQHGHALTSEMRSKLSELRNQIYRIMSDRAISEVPVNILYSQNAQFTLEQFVENNPLVDAALIQDDKGFIIEGWPLAFLGLQSEVLAQHTLTAMNSTRQAAETQLLWLLPEQYTTSTINKSATSAQHGALHLLIYSIPLFAETDSIITPYMSTGTLNVVINQVQLSSHERHTEIGDQHNLQLKANGFSLIKSHPMTISDTLSQTFTTQIMLHSQSGLKPLELVLDYDRQFHTAAFWRQTTQQVAPLLLFIPFVIWGLFRFTRNFKRPINQMVEICRNLVSGNYEAKSQSATFQEFDLVFRRLDKMAKTIYEQIQSLESARLKAEHSERIKSQFLANMSHEIRTPMNGVLGMLQLMESGTLSDEQRQRVNIAKTSAQNLLQIINDILDISKIEANKIVIEQVHCNVAELIHNLTDSMQPLAATRNNILKNLVKPPFHCHWLTDPTRIGQIFTNLLSNALKFTQDGKVMVVLAQPDENHFEITVKDTGIGIAQDKLNTLFQPFQQADSSTTREYGGTGLGLSISKNLCELMGGSLKVSSEPGKGSKFVATILAIRTEHVNEHQNNNQDTNLSNVAFSEATGTDVKSTKKVAVVAEDNEINQEVLKAMLEGRGLDLHIANNGRDAVALVEYLKPDIVLMDVHMPLMDGVTATQTIRERGHTMPVIMQTANVMHEDVKEYMRIGANDVVAKPIVQRQLIETLNKWLRVN